MKILVLGAGAIGGYFGARLMQAGADVTFLVRERRASQLAARGLVVQSPHGDFTLPPKWLLAKDLDQQYDLVLLACKAYDLDSAIDAIRPAMGPDSHVLPLLNGLSHLDRLAETFGAARVIGGCCAIPGTLGPEGEVIQMNPVHRIVYGALPGTSPGARTKLEELHALFGKTSVSAALADDMMLEMWEKFVGLATMATMTCLMRASIGIIMSTEEGPGLMEDTLEACIRTATANGHAPREAMIANTRAMIFDRSSPVTASMARDVEANGRTEGRHVVADMLRRARAAKVDPGPLRAAWCHLEAHQLRFGQAS